MKITDVVCSAGRTGFYFDDQRAIKRGAGHDGLFYVGTPVTEGFKAIRQAGESISVMLVLEDGQIQDILSREMKLEEKKRTLIDAALKNGSRDNITVVLIEI